MPIYHVQVPYLSWGNNHFVQPNRKHYILAILLFNYLYIKKRGERQRIHHKNITTELKQNIIRARQRRRYSIYHSILISIPLYQNSLPPSFNFQITLKTESTICQIISHKISLVLDCVLERFTSKPETTKINKGKERK